MEDEVGPAPVMNAGSEIKAEEAPSNHTNASGGEEMKGGDAAISMEEVVARWNLEDVGGQASAEEDPCLDRAKEGTPTPPTPPALSGVSFASGKGELCAVVGAVGSGKVNFLHVCKALFISIVFFKRVLSCTPC